MAKISLSLWLPVSRPNFFSFSAMDWMTQDPVDSTLRSSTRLEHKDYVPLLHVSVLRRLLEVMPRSFGYNPKGKCGFRGDAKARQRPNSIEMTLDLSSTNLSGGEESPQWRANHALVAAGVSTVTLRADENGNYAFTATVPGASSYEEARCAVEPLTTHIREVFGGGYSVHPLRATENRRHNAGDAAVKQYNGIEERDGEEQTVGPPLGAFNFFQLNTLAEGLWNDMLLPAVYLEQEEFMTTFLGSKEDTELLRSMGDIVAGLTTEADASDPEGQFVVLHHFLTMTAHSSLQRLKSSLESVRRRLLDEMMSALHRQSRLVQLNFSANPRERRPEFAVGATELQLRGYTSLVAAKLPLITNVREVVRLAQEHLEWVVTSNPEAADRSADKTQTLVRELRRLDGPLTNWNMLLDDLAKNVGSLETSIEQAWMERMLYEQQQARSEQEAMAEIERSRQSRPAIQHASRSFYNLIMLVLAAAAVIVTVASTDLRRIGSPEIGWLEIFTALWPVWTIAVIAYGVVPGIGLVRRASKEKHSVLTSYPYEFAFRLDEPVNQKNICRSLDNTQPRKIKSAVLPQLSVTNRGYGRIERVSVDTTILKTHSAAAFRVGLMRYARFEIINEILIHKIASTTQHVLVQCRMFGESPKPLRSGTVHEFVHLIINDVAEQIAVDEHIDLSSVLDESLYHLPDNVPVQGRSRKQRSGGHDVTVPSKV